MITKDKDLTVVFDRAEPAKGNFLQEAFPSHKSVNVGCLSAHDAAAPNCLRGKKLIDPLIAGELNGQRHVARSFELKLIHR